MMIAEVMVEVLLLLLIIWLLIVKVTIVKSSDGRLVLPKVAAISASKFIDITTSIPGNFAIPLSLRYKVF